jgi:hypothetical protein
LRKYFLSKLENGVSERAGVGTARLEAAPEVEPRKGSNGNNSNPKTVKEKRKSWEREDNSAKIARSKSQRGSQEGFNGHGVNERVLMSESKPRPTRKFGFKWDPFPNTLRVTKIVGQAR